MPTPFDDTPELNDAYEEKQQQASALYEQEARADFQTGRSRFHGRTQSSVIAIVLGCVLLGAMWKLGVINRGYEKRRLVFNSPGASSRNGFQFGTKTMYATTGQTIAVKYDAQVARGYFQIWIRETAFGLLGPVVAHTGTVRSSAGTIKYTVPRNGLYKILIDGSPDGNGYDVTYTASWSTK